MKIFGNRKLRVDVLTAFTTLICLTVACEIIYASMANKKIVLQFEKEYYSKKLSTTAVNWIDAYFQNMEIVINILARHYDTSNEDSLWGFKNLFLESVKQVPFMTGAYIATTDGRYLQVCSAAELPGFIDEKKKALPSYAKFAIQRIIKNKDNPEELNETWTYVNEDFGEVASEALKTPLFDPRKRDWFMKAELSHHLVWSDAYIFMTTKTPGITLSKPIMLGDDVKCVFGVDFTLSGFRELLSGVKFTDNSKIYMISEENYILASSDSSKEPTLVDTGASNQEKILAINFSKVNGSSDPVLHAAAKNLFGTKEVHTTFSVDNIKYVATTKKLTTLPIGLLIITPQRDFTADFEKVQTRMLLISFLIFIFSFIFIWFLTKRISLPITQLCDSARAIERLDIEGYPAPPKSKILEIMELSSTMEAMKLSVATFAKYAPKDLVKKLLRHGIQPELGGYTKNVTMMFTDIEKFSTISENLPAEYLILHLSEYFDELTKKIMEHNGMIDKYIGDSIMAIWGAPNDDENQVINACYAALECQIVLENLKKKWAPLGKPPLPTRIGLHSGTTIVGNIGSQDRMNFTAIGDAVNIASRLEGANKIYGTKILASETVEAAARGKVLFRVIDKIAVKGRASGTIVYEPLRAMKDADDNEYYKLIELSSKSKEAFELYQNRQFKSAMKIYEGILEMFPQTGLSVSCMIEKCKLLIEHTPEDWDGITQLHDK